MSAWLCHTQEFSIRNPYAQRLFEILISAYPYKDRIRDLLNGTGIREADVDTETGNARKVWLGVLGHAARAGLLRELVEAAARDVTIANYWPQLQPFLDDDANAAETTDQTPDQESLLRDAKAMLAALGPCRSPIIIALELDDEPLAEFELARTACHLTVTMTEKQVRVLGSIARRAFADAGSIVDLVEAGGRVWQELKDAEPRLRALHERIAGAGLTQPIAWCGRPALLEQMSAPLQIAHTGGSGARGFLSVGAGGHYLMPVHSTQDAGNARTMKHRAETAKLSVRLVDLRDAGTDLSRGWLGQVGMADIVMAVHRADQPILNDLGTAVREEVVRPTRAVLTFGDHVPVREIDTLLEVVPFVSFADVAVAEPALLTALETSLRGHAESIALPCIVAAVRAAWLGRATERDDVAACRHGLAWSVWSWIGLPLFSRSYGEVGSAAYPHLMDLRSVASREWYFDRREKIPGVYQASALARAARSADEQFHLYLSGAGGTGKSCFLRHVHDEIDARATSIAVWYQVDAPSSPWENVESRVREKTVRAVGDEFDARTAEDVAQIRGGLGDFLRGAASLLREREPGFGEIAVFIDQLERTFESGDEPNPHLLEGISYQLVQLLKDVGVGNGVRVFVASRKQYLPDFLGSFRSAAACHLEFNVLQSITEQSERIAFVQRVLGWCRRQELVAPRVTMGEDATKVLVANVDGNPLNMMLALIQLLSQNFSGTITVDDVKRHEPWNRLFLLDIDAAERDELDWHFLLAMSHARTEIVRFEEVWWRIRMVSPRLTRRVEDLRRSGVIERLWLLGFLGRTIHGRPFAGDSVRFVEFFHANLRDYLLREVMGQGRSGAGIGGRHGGTPAAWRALDRLSVFAHDWAQTLQLLLAEEIRVLMEHREQVIETRLALDEDATLPFHLLFLRDRGEAREELSKAAMECFAFSALVHDEAGRWAVETLFTDVDDRVARCRDWLRRCPVELRPAVLRYLVPLESPSARKLLIELLFDLGGVLRDEMAQAAAAVLTEPLFAARWRNEVLLAILGEALRRVGGEPGRLPAYVPAFVVSACGHDRDMLVGVINYCVDRLSTSEDANLRVLAPGLEAFSGLDGWLGAANAAPGLRGLGVVDRGAAGGAPLELVLGEDLRWAADDARLADWSASLRGALGVPVPDLELRDGEVEPDEAELRFYGQRISRSVFRPDRLCVSKRLWELAGGPRSSYVVQGVEGGEDVLWLPAPVVAAADFRFTSLDFDGAVGRWLESRCRRSFDQLFDVELQLAFVREVASTPAGRRRLRPIGGRLRTVLVNLVKEGVPLGSRDSVLEQLADLAPRITRNDQLTQKIREYVKADICRSVADESGQVTTILLDERLEQALADRVVETDGRLALTPSEAIRLDAAIQRHVLRSTEDGAGPPLVVVTVPRLRAALARLLHGLDYRLPVLSFTELEQDLIAVPGGLVDVPLEHGTPA